MNFRSVLQVRSSGIIENLPSNIQPCVECSDLVSLCARHDSTNHFYQVDKQLVRTLAAPQAKQTTQTNKDGICHKI